MQYVGQSIDIERRKKQHEYDYLIEDYPLYKAMRTYGLSQFTFSVLEECKIEELNDRETF